MTTHPSPTFRRQNGDMIPKVLLRAMLALALSALAITTYAVLTDRPTVGQPQPAAVLTERTLILQGGGAKAVKVLTPDGTVVADLDHGGFVAVVQNGLQTARGRHGIDPALPVRLVSYANGRLALEDPLTGWSVQLHAFGSDNKAAFERLLTE